MVNKKALTDWAIQQKRVTNGMIRKEFGIDEEWADQCYEYLRDTGIVGRMGYTTQYLYGSKAMAGRAE